MLALALVKKSLTPSILPSAPQHWIANPTGSRLSTAIQTAAAGRLRAEDLPIAMHQHDRLHSTPVPNITCTRLRAAQVSYP